MNKNQIYNVIISVSLFVLIVFRIFGNIQENVVPVINFVGMSVAFISILFRLEHNAPNRKKPIWFFVSLIAIILAVIIAMLISVNKIELNEKSNDVITLFALLFSLPSDLYVKIFSPIKKSDSIK